MDRLIQPTQFFNKAFSVNLYLSLITHSPSMHELTRQDYNS